MNGLKADKPMHDCANRILVAGLAMCATLLYGETMSTNAPQAATMPWDRKALYQAPKTYPAPGFEAAGVKALFYESVPYKGKPTRVFAWYGAPTVKPGEKLPAMVILHGGGGSAMADRVQFWTQRGYAAISMDLSGCTPGQEGKHPRHEFGGPPSWCGFDQLDEPIGDQHMYHAVAAVLLADSLLRSYPAVDTNRIGMVGGSMGSYLASIVAGVDDRFALSINVFGCGFLADNSCWLETFQKLGPEKTAKWVSLWDPSSYLKNARMPIFWLNGTHDHFFPLDSFQKSYRLAAGPRTVALRIRMPHGGWDSLPQDEMAKFAASILKGGRPLANVTKTEQKARLVTVSFESPAPVIRAEFNYTIDAGRWIDRRWETVEAPLNATQGVATAYLPDPTKAYFFNLIDNEGFLVSSEYVEPPEAPTAVK
jgi:pimeloyl-ACP methyl ester carboxylesterase